MPTPSTPRRAGLAALALAAAATLLPSAAPAQQAPDTIAAIRA